MTLHEINRGCFLAIPLSTFILPALDTDLIAIVKTVSNEVGRQLSGILMVQLESLKRLDPLVSHGLARTLEGKYGVLTRHHKCTVFKRMLGLIASLLSKISVGELCAALHTAHAPRAHRLGLPTKPFRPDYVLEILGNVQMRVERAVLLRVPFDLHTRDEEVFELVRDYIAFVHDFLLFLPYNRRVDKIGLLGLLEVELTHVYLACQDRLDDLVAILHDRLVLFVFDLGIFELLDHIISLHSVLNLVCRGGGMVDHGENIVQQAAVDVLQLLHHLG
mmetsp:Transcript_31752/g.44438  ORF Transcript_31752/g.44438 Transcript_31752/m.44438 type:complete len:276 (+) Transcript_31752:52-879(+)